MPINCICGTVAPIAVIPQLYGGRCGAHPLDSPNVIWTLHLGWDWHHFGTLGCMALLSKWQKLMQMEDSEEKNIINSFGLKELSHASLHFFRGLPSSCLHPLYWNKTHFLNSSLKSCRWYRRCNSEIEKAYLRQTVQNYELLKSTISINHRDGNPPSKFIVSCTNPLENQNSVIAFIDLDDSLKCSSYVIPMYC